jgi:biotin carboxylase
MLGGSYFQTPAIKYAKAAGYYVITCDYLPENPGHIYADEYYNLSTTDLEGVLSLSKKLNIDGIVAYASDPAAATAAYVAQELDLSGNPYKSVRILTEKDLFRDFLRENNFNVPMSKGYCSFKDLIIDIDEITLPIMIKPVDSSGSKGVCMINTNSEIENGFKYAQSFSRKGRVIVEEYISGLGPQMHGDAFVVDGKLTFCYLGDHHYNNRINPFVPYSTTLPSIHLKETLEKVEIELQKLITVLDLKQGALNIEARLGVDGLIYLMEVGPRNGGNLVPQLEYYATGFDMVSASVDIVLGNYTYKDICEKRGFFSYYVLHSEQEGILEGVVISDSLKNHILEKHIFKKDGDIINAFNGSNATIGILMLKFDSMDEMNQITDNMEKYVNILLV